MIDPKVLEDMARRLADALPPGLRQFQSDMERNAHAVLQSAFARMDLVTREEFDVQRGVLARTREKLAALEARLAQLEAADAPEASAAKADTIETSPRRKPKPKNPDAQSE